MIPKKDQHVRCVLRNNLIIEGTVDSWSDAKSVLRSLDGSSVSIIQHTAQDIVVVKIILQEPVKEKKEPIQARVEAKTELEKKFDEVYQSPSDNELRVKNLAELKTLMNEQERKIISERIKNHQATDVRKVTYGQPEFLKKQST